MQEAANGTTTYTGSATKTGDGKTIQHRPGIIDFVKDQGTYTLESTKHPTDYDADGDGIADAWEQANGGNLDPKAKTLDPKGWYTNLEVYANSLVEDIMKAGNADGDANFTEYYPTWQSPTAIQTIKNDAETSSAIYNLAGQKVDASYKGVVIKNNTKYVIK